MNAYKKEIIMIFLLCAAYGMAAQNTLYLMGGLDSYQLLNQSYPSGNGFNLGLQYLIAGKNKPIVQWGIETVYQYRQQCISDYNGGNMAIPGGPIFIGSNNIQINPFIRLGSGVGFIDAGLFANTRISSEEKYNFTANPESGFDIGFTGAVGARLNALTLSVKFTYGLKNLNTRQFASDPKFNSLNLSLEAGLRLFSSRQR